MEVKNDDLSEFLKSVCGSTAQYPELVIRPLTNETDVVPNLLENYNKGLKFRKLNDDQIIVEFNENVTVEHYTEPRNEQMLMSYNFQKVEDFCHTFEKINRVDEVENFLPRFYILVKNFSDEKIHVPEKEAQIYIISEVSFSEYIEITVYANGKSNENKGSVCIDVEKKRNFSEKSRDIVLCISVIDREGNEKFTQTEVFHDKPDDIYGTDTMNDVKQLCISRETILNNPLESLHYDDLVLCINIEFDRPPYHTETEEKINFSLKKRSGVIYELLLDSDIGRLLCRNSEFFRNMVRETQIVLINPEDVDDVRNICRRLDGANYVKLQNHKDIYYLYQTAHKYKIYPVVEFCKTVLKKHVPYPDTFFLRSLAEDYNDVELRDIVKSFQKHPGKYERFICRDVCLFEEEESEREKTCLHIHYARGEYVQCDNLVSTVEKYSSSNGNFEEIEAKFNFSAIFSTHGTEKITLSMDSDFGKIFCEKSNFLKNMQELMCSDTETDKIEILQEHFEAFKNIYRLLMGANHIKATTIVDIISLYERGDYYDIPPVLEVCRHLFKRHICTRIYQPILNLSLKCLGDFELEEIVKDFDADFQRYISEAREHYPEWMKITRPGNFVEVDEILGVEHNFASYQ